MFRLLPREDKYFEMFNSMASHMTECALLLQKIFSDFDNRAAYADKIKEVEHECDVITHEIIKKLNQTFITPIDREDIHALISGLDDIVDAIEYTAKRVILYRVDSPTDHARKMSDVVVRIVASLEKAIRSLEKNGAGRPSTRPAPKTPSRAPRISANHPDSRKARITTAPKP